MKQLFLFLSVVSFSYINGQNAQKDFGNLVSKDSFVVTTLFSYPDSIYSAVLVASTYPQGFEKLSEIQKNSSSSFQKVISTFNRTRQKQLWEITRYPELIPILIQNKDKSKIELNALLINYPDKIKNSAIYFVRNNYSTLVEIDNVHKDFKSNYQLLQKDFPGEVKESYNKLIRNPELITLLSENIQTTTALGELYRKNSSMVKQQADSLNFEIVKEKGIEYENWKQGIQKNTVLQKELRQLGEKYENEDTYDDDVYARSDDPREVNEVFDVSPYPYWAGYPHWYGANYWYPYPWWYQMGFYWPMHGPMQFYGLPTYHFGWWYYNQPQRYYRRYPNANNYFYRHNEGRRNYNSDCNRSTQEFYRGRRK